MAHGKRDGAGRRRAVRIPCCRCTARLHLVLLLASCCSRSAVNYQIRVFIIQLAHDFGPSHRPTYWYPVAVSRKKASAMQVDHYAPVVWLLAFIAECTFWCRSTVRLYLGMLSTLVVRGPLPLSTIFTIRTVLVRLRTNYVLKNKPEIVIFLSRETF